MLLCQFATVYKYVQNMLYKILCYQYLYKLELWCVPLVGDSEISNLCYGSGSDIFLADQILKKPGKSRYLD